MPNENNSEGKRWGRRAVGCGVWAVLVTAAWYAALFKGVGLEWWLEYAKYFTFALGFLVGGLTITDAILKPKKA